MSVLSNKDTTIYLSQERLAEWAGIIATSSVRRSKIYQNKAETLRYYLHAIQYEFFLEESEIISILTCLNELADLQEWPTAPILGEKEQPNILLGIPGQDGTDGNDGATGSDAEIDCEADPFYDNMAVTEYINAGIKTYKFGYAPHTPPIISLVVNNNSLVLESGQNYDPVPVVTTLNKGRDTVLSSSVTAPAALDVEYQGLLDLSSLNLGNQEVVTVNDHDVQVTTVYTVGVTDAKGTTSTTKTLTFVLPFLYGSSATLLSQTTYYNNLNKLIQVKGNKTVNFNDISKYFYFIYPATYGDLSVILDGNGFNATSAFIKTTEPIDMLSTIGDSMIVYRTLITDISNQDYQFKF